MKTTKTKKALDFLAAHPGKTVYAAAKHIGVSASTLYRALAARKGKVVCPTCGHTIKK